MSQKENSLPQKLNENSPPTLKSSAQQKKLTKFESSHGNRLGGLIYHPELIKQHREMLESKMSTINLTRKVVEYAGCGLFVLHMIKGKLRIRKTTGFYIAVPPTLSYIIKLLGYSWVDNYAERSGLYKMYRISTL